MSIFSKNKLNFRTSDTFSKQLLNFETALMMYRDNIIVILYHLFDMIHIP